MKANFGPAYAGALYLYSSGDDYSDATKSKTGGGGIDFNPALLLGNDDYGTWSGTDTQISINGVTYTSAKSNTHMIKVFGGYDPTPKLNLELAFISATRDKANLSATTEAVSKNLGMELDATVSYKIYDNLTYMVGAAYLWTGDYFKGTDSTKTVGNDYLLMNKLTLSF